MPEEDPIDPPNSKVRKSITLLIPATFILGFIILIIFDRPFSDYIASTATEGFYSAKEGFEMLEYLLVIALGIIVAVFLYAQYVLRIKKTPRERQEKLIQFFNDEKALAIFCFIFLIISILIYAPYQEYIKDKETIDRLENVNNLALTKKSIAPVKALPMKSIPTQELAQPIVTQAVQKATDVQTAATVFVKDFAPTNSDGNELETFNEQRRARAQAKTGAVNDYWTNALPYYDQAILLLRDALKQRAETNNEQVETAPAPTQFLQCLPRTISTEYIPDEKFGEIKLSKNTNMDFTVYIQGSQDEQRLLKISCSCGFFMIHPYGGQFYWRIKTQEIDDTEMPFSFDESKQRTADGLRLLIERQAAFLSQTNH